MKLIDIISEFESIAPLALQESYDNSGLLVGNPQQDVSKALLCIDSTEEVVDEAIAKGCNLIVAHHPIVFKGLKRFNGSDYVQRAVIKAIQHNIAIYACHTNLDNVLVHGVNAKIAEKLGIENLRILKPKANNIMKLAVFVPIEFTQVVVNAMFAAGAGQIGKYSECSFVSEGNGTFMPSENAEPFLGNKNIRNEVAENKVEMILPKNDIHRVVSAMMEAHPYEEVAYDILSLENIDNSVGSGLLGELPESLTEIQFLERLKSNMDIPMIKFTKGKGTVKRVAICGGAGSFLIDDAKKAGADAFVTADVKYHEFFDADNRLMICDLGHYESEKYTIDIFAEIISRKFPNFATIFSDTCTNPVRYYY